MTVEARATAISANSPVIATVSFITLACLVPLLLLTPAFGPLEPTQLTLRVLIIGYSAVMISVLLGRGRPDWFATIFWSFVYVWLGIAGLAQAFAGRDPFRLPVDPTADTSAAFVTLLGMVAWHAVYRFTTARVELIAPRPGRLVTPRATILVFWVAIVITPAFLMYLGDPLFFMTTRIEASAGLAEAAGGSLAVRGLVTAFAQVPPFVALLAITLMLQAHKPLRYRPAWWTMLAVTLALNVLVNNPLGNSRFWFGTVLIGWLLCWKAFRTPAGYRTIVAALLIGLTVVFPYADYFRTPDATVTARAPYQFMVEKLDYDAVAQIRNAATVHEFSGPAYGAQLLSTVGFAVPRDIWPQKAEPTGVLLARGIDFHFENLSAPLWAEGWVDWGPVGAVLYPALFGFLGGMGDRRFRIALGAQGAQLALIAMPALAIYSLILIRGSLLGTIAQGAFLAIALMVMGSARASHPSATTVGPARRRDQNSPERSAKLSVGDT
ncbi:hypothetical protein [Microbacterium aurantiacum]|uniref:Oligosaccharide repeat unit polymerase n=1 Tax=Microbacterium aurantiacum TaxID=162393 RepID=A0ABT8FUZ2_9MICO|nr:hypothetical protein [Microbacterium aurantiacum]MDN4465138.1 hypothetical protein [Microbacterium aurantiacum]